MSTLDKDIRKAIINTSKELFSQFGFKKTTMDDIARATHKAKSSLYHYFKSKEQIFEAVVKDESEHLRKEIEGSIREKDTPQEKLHSYITTRHKVLVRLGDFYKKLAYEYFEHYNLVERIRINYVNMEIRQIEEILDQGMKEGVFVIQHLEGTARAIVTALKGLEYSWATGNDDPNCKKDIGSLLGILFHGILKR